MPRAPRIPAELTKGPFSAQEAKLRGLTKDQLRGLSWRRVDRGVFAWHALADRRMVRLRAALQRLPDGAVFSGSTAGWLHGLDLEPCDPIEATVPAACMVTRRSGVTLHRSACLDRSRAQGLPVTTRVRTVADLMCRQNLVDAVMILDMALHRHLVSLGLVARWAEANSGRRGVALLRRALEFAEPATESPMETRLRLLLVLSGLPKPQVQPTLRGDTGMFIARPDLFYPIRRLVIEYDGASHKDSVAGDNRRQNRLLEAGYRILRFTASDVLGNPSDVVSLVRRAIARPPETS